MLCWPSHRAYWLHTTLQDVQLVFVGFMDMDSRIFRFFPSLGCRDLGSEVDGAVQPVLAACGFKVPLLHTTATSPPAAYTFNLNLAKRRRKRRTRALPTSRGHGRPARYLATGMSLGSGVGRSVV